jgi:PDZ domain-containing protein
MTAARRRTLSVVAAVLGALLVASAWVPLPYYALGPGPGSDVLPLIAFDGRPRYEPSGHLVMTTVRIVQVTPLGAFVTWVDPQRSLMREDDVFPPGIDQDVEEQRSISQMDTSKIDAASVVLRMLADYPEAHGEGALIESTLAGCPADGELFPGDVILSIDGRPIDSLAEASRVIEGVPPGQDMRFTLDVDGRTERATFARERCAEGEGPLVGVAMLNAFPFPVTISSGDVGGPSAGLMFALGLYELMTPSDLTGGRTIAGTGELGPDGTVYPISGVADKVIAAERAGATVFLVPRDNLAELQGVDVGGIHLIPVGTFEDALRALGEGVPAE